MISLSSDPGQVTAALRQWRSRSHFPTDLTSAQIRGFSKELRMRSVFSARMTNAEACQALADIVDDMLSGKYAMAEGRYRMMRVLKTLGYDPATGFPQDMANIPPAERDSLRDLSSETRLNLMLETNVRVAANYGRMTAGNSDYALRWYPAWELVRLYIRSVPRGTPESHSEGWGKRWLDAAESVSWVGVARAAFEDSGRMIALKDSPIWAALGDGEGGYSDCLGNPFPPFAFNSGYGWSAVSRERCLELGLIEGDQVSKAGIGQLNPTEAEITTAFDRLSPDLKAQMEAKWAA